MHTTVKNQQKVCWKFKWDDKRGPQKEVILTKIANVHFIIWIFNQLLANFCQIYLFPQICQFHQICPFPRTKPVRTLEHLNDTWSDLLYVHCTYMYYPEQSMQSTFKDNMEFTKHIITWNCFLFCLKTRALLGIDSLWFNYYSCKRPPPVSIVRSVRNQRLKYMVFNIKTPKINIQLNTTCSWFGNHLDQKMVSDERWQRKWLKMAMTNSKYIISVLRRCPSEKGVGWITSISLFFLTHRTFYSCPKWLQIFKQISTLINFQASWLQQTTKLNNIKTVSSEDNKIMYTKKENAQLW